MSARRGKPGQEALAELCEQYWFPLYAYLRRRGRSAEDAQDLTQGLFLRLLEKDDLAAVSPEKGRFRSFLLTALKFYASNEWDRHQTQKRGGHLERVELHFEDGESRYQAEGEQWSPEVVFERSWARVVSERALERLQQQYVARRQAAEFDSLRPSLTGDVGASTVRELAAALGKSEGATKVALHRLRQRFGETLRLEIAETVADRRQIDDELRNLIGALRF